EMQPGSDVDGALVDCHRGFLDGFAQGRVGVVGAGDVFAAGTEGHRGDGFVDHVRCVGAQDVDAKDPVGLRVGDDLDLPLRLTHRPGAAVGAEGEFADPHLVALRHRVLLRPSDLCQLGVRVDDRGNGVVVHVPELPGHDLDG